MTMATTMNFEEWIDGVDPDDYNEVYCIYRSVADLNEDNDVEEWGGFKASRKETSRGPMYFIKSTFSDEVLMLASDKARDAFIDYLTKRFAGEELDIEGWYYFKYEMDKED